MCGKSDRGMLRHGVVLDLVCKSCSECGYLILWLDKADWRAWALCSIQKHGQTCYNRNKLQILVIYEKCWCLQN